MAWIHWRRFSHHSVSMSITSNVTIIFSPKKNRFPNEFSLMPKAKTLFFSPKKTEMGIVFQTAINCTNILFSLLFLVSSITTRAELLNSRLMKAKLGRRQFFSLLQSKYELQWVTWKERWKEIKWLKRCGAASSFFSSSLYFAIILWHRRWVECKRHSKRCSYYRIFSISQRPLFQIAYFLP